MSFFGRIFNNKKSVTVSKDSKEQQQVTPDVKIENKTNPNSSLKSSASQKKIIVKSQSTRNVLKPNPIANESNTSNAIKETNKPNGDKQNVTTNKRPNSAEVMPEESMKALVKIQRFAKKVIIQKENEDEENWKIFQGLDQLEEKEALQFATFFQVLTDKIPKESYASSKNHQSMKGSSETSKSSDTLNYDEILDPDTIGNIEIEGLAGGSSGNKVARNSFDFGTNKSAPLSPHVVEGIIEVCRQGGKLSSNTVMKLLRRTYALLKQSGNTRKISVPQGGKLTIVGDLHGQLSDLLYILDESGLPSATNKFVFNGDFVDRGDYGVEVTCLLMALYLSEPQNVILNRGNHEDAAITRAYGFMDECIEKYDELTYGMFSEVFRYLPLFVLINDCIFIVHGGLFNNRAVTLSDLDKINRIDYVARPPMSYPQCLEGLDNDAQWIEYYKQLQRDALWSDPQLESGLMESERGAGVMFGPDVAQTFMDTNNLHMIIRSHEMVKKGFLLNYSNCVIPTHHPPDAPLLATIFSASNYSEGDNEGAYIVIMDHGHADSAKIKSSNLHYSAHHYRTMDFIEDVHNGSSSSTTVSTKKSTHFDKKSTLNELIFKRKKPLQLAFECLDETQTNLITREKWAETMAKETRVKIRWLSLLPSICPKEALTPTMVNYRLFLEKYSVPILPSSKPGKAGGKIATSAMMDSLYGNRKKLEAMFSFFDTNGDGVISTEEFHIGVEALNEGLQGKDDRVFVDNLGHFFELMDFDKSGNIDMNEFSEMFRLIDQKIKGK